MEIGVNFNLSPFGITYIKNRLKNVFIHVINSDLSMSLESYRWIPERIDLSSFYIYFSSWIAVDGVNY